MKPSFLIFGAMPDDARPESHIAVGPWCFAGREEKFPAWEDNFAFAPEPLNTPETLELACGRSLTLTASIVMPLAERLCFERGRKFPNLPPVFWETFFTPWCNNMSVQIVQRMARIRAVVAALEKQRFIVPLLPEECTFRFKTENDFIFGGALGHNYSHWLFSRLLEPCLPTAWKVEYLPAVHEEYAPPKEGFFHRVFDGMARRALLSLGFPKPKGFGMWQSLRFSMALSDNTNKEDRSRPLSDFIGPEPDLSRDPLSLFMASLPQSMREMSIPRFLLHDFEKKTRVAHISAYEDAAYRGRLARWRAKGNKLVHIQHGGNYGHVSSSALAAITEYSQHAFITWGWRRQKPQKGNFIPLPHGQAARLRGMHQDKSGKLLMVGMEMTVFPYRVDARPTPVQYISYRKSKELFLKALPENVPVLYRPYFPVPGTLVDGEWLGGRIPELKICSGPLDPHMLSCRLLVLDHHGTTLLLAMAANVPMVLYWDPASFHLCPEAEAIFNCLASAAIWHHDPLSAAKHIEAVWDDVQGWWNSDPVRTARGHFARLYAHTVPGPIDGPWIKLLKNV